MISINISGIISSLPKVKAAAISWDFQPSIVLKEKFKNVILGKSNFTYKLSSNLTGYETIYSSNSAILLGG
jgi:hypothetical protein